MRRLLFLLVLLAPLSGERVRAQMATPPRQVGVSPRIPTYFHFTRSPQAFCFFPGNIASEAFGERPPEVPATRGTAVDELRCNAGVLLLDSPAYSRRFPLRDPSGEPRGQWWEILTQLLGNMQDKGFAVDLRVNNSFLERLRHSQDGISRFSKGLSTILGAYHTAPMITFEVPVRANEAAAEALRDALKRDLPRALLGRVVEELPDSRDTLTGWRFVILRPEILPTWQRGQAAMTYLHGSLGQVPVVLRLHRPDFYRDLVYLATGAAGFQYDAFPPAGAENDQRFRALRAFAAVKARLRDGAVRLMPEHRVPGTVGVFGMEGEVYALILHRSGQVKFRVPEVPGFPSFLGSWYRPATDELIARPRSTPPPDANGEILLVPPTPEAAWIYWHVPFAPR